MTKMYQLMIGRKQVNDLYYDRDDAIDNAKQLVRDTGLPVSVWVAEDTEGVDELDWTMLTTISYIKRRKRMAGDGNGAAYYTLGYVMAEERVIEYYDESEVE